MAHEGLLIELISSAVQADQTFGKKIIGPDKQIIESIFSACGISITFLVTPTTVLDNLSSKLTILSITE